MHILLASSSPRRLELLKAVGLKVKTIAPDVLEVQLKGESPTEMVGRLAKLKADTVYTKTPTQLPIVAADTIVCLEGMVLGKPLDKIDAVRTLKMLSGKEHEVITGYIVRKEADEIMGIVTTKVSFRTLKETEIYSYIETGEPLDKAGAYAIQGAGASLVDHITGNYTNVIGLPVNEILKALNYR